MRLPEVAPQINKLTEAMTDIIYKDESYRLIGCCFEVYNEKGCGFLESVYQECLEIELELQGIPFSRQKVLPLSYKGRSLSQKYIPDFICCDKIILEIKAVPTGLQPAHGRARQQGRERPS